MTIYDCCNNRMIVYDSYDYIFNPSDRNWKKLIKYLNHIKNRILKNV